MTTVYADMCADLFHFGHVRFLRAAKGLGTRLIVGICSDETMRSYKRTPILNMQERAEVVAACRYVDEVICDAPWRPTADYLRAIGADVVCHGDDYSEDQVRFYYGLLPDGIPLKLVPYTRDISTTQILKRIEALSVHPGPMTS